jgi:hypothetical protein
MNAGGQGFLAFFLGCDSVTPHNGVRLVFHPQGLCPFVENRESGDIALQELRTESFFPADEATRLVLTS